MQTANGNIQVHTPSQLDFEKFLAQAVEGYYKRTGKNLPAEISGGNLTYQRSSIFQRRHIGAVTSLKLFEAPDVEVGFKGNFLNAKNTANEIFVATGIIILSAAGVSAATANDLDFDRVDVTAAPVICNGLFDLAMNKRDVFDKLPISSSVLNTDLRGFIPFDNMEIVDASSGLKAEFNFGVAVGDYWMHCELVGYRVGKNVK